jgi:hypothetical protein
MALRGNASVANSFELAGNDVFVTYRPGLAGEPQLSYQDRYLQRSFRGDEVDVVEGQLGALVTVTLSATPDLGSSTFTLLVPTTVVSGESAKVDTLAIMALHRTPLDPSSIGQRDSYTSTQLSGTAQVIDT